MRSLRGKTAIVGAADTAVGKVPDLSATELCVDAALRALADAGISKDEVDGILTCQSMAAMNQLSLRGAGSVSTPEPEASETSVLTS